MMRYIFSSPYYLNERATGANKRFECILYALQDKHKVGIVVVKGQIPLRVNTSVSIYEIPLFIAKNRFLTFLYLNFLYLYFSLRKNVVISDFNPIPLSMFFSKKQFQLIHDARIFNDFGRWGKLSAVLMKFQWKYIRRRIVVSQFTKDKLYDELSINPSSIIVSYNGAYAPSIDNGVSNNREIDLLYVATFEERKNHINLVKALGLIDRPLKMTFLGRDLGLKFEIESEASKLKHHQIIFLDAISEDKLSQLYKNSKIFISPSLYEGFGMPILEAYIHGCKVLCSDLFVFHEVLAEKAVYFDPIDIENIASVIKSSLISIKDDNSVSMHIPQEFNWLEISEKLISDISSSNFK